MSPGSISKIVESRHVNGRRPVSDTVLNVVVGLVTSVVSATAVWLWQHARNARVVRRKAAFFGIQSGGTCLIIMNNKWSKPGSTAHPDVHALIEIATLAHDLGAEISVRSCDEIRESNGDRTEFCVGGPLQNSNPRSGAYAAAYLPGVAFRPHSRRPDSLALVVAGRSFPYHHGNEEHALVAKFTPTTAKRPVVLICGQSATMNRAAVHLLKRDYRTLAKRVASTDRFCVIVRARSIPTYGHEAVEYVDDVTAAAFTVVP
jgi:hypothetical protein